MLHRWILLSALALVACGGADEDREAAPIVADEPAAGGEGAAEPAGEAPEGRLVVGDDACTSDGDCVPAECCHPAACVARASAPDCGEVMCTMECRADTMDCGGSCLCHEGRCAARLAPAQAAPVQ